jgi:Tol biopolymer transport system component
VWRVPEAGGTPTRVTSGSGVESRPRPSPDGRWVMFDSAGVWTWLMRPDGSGSHAATDWGKQYSGSSNGAWSPDGSKVAMTIWMADGAARLGLAALDAESGTLRNLTMHDVPGLGEEYPRWSPDGRSIAYESFSDGSWNLWTADENGQSPRQLTSLPGNERQATWQASPLFVYYVTDDGVLWRIPMANSTTAAGPPVRWLALPRLRVAPDSADISPDHARIVVALIKPESDVWLVERK